MTGTEASPKLKLALVHPQWRPDGGAERAVMNTLSALGDDIRITVISRHAWEVRDQKIHFIKCDPFYIGRLWRKWGFTRSATRALTKIRVDLVQSQVRLPGCDIYRAGGGVHREWLNQRKRISNRLKQLSVLISPYHQYKLHVEKKMYRHRALKAVICNSAMVRQELISHYRMDESRIHVIYNAVDLEKFNGEKIAPFRMETRQRLGLGENETLFLFVGSGFERKGLGQLIKSVALLPAACHVAVVGKDSHQGAYFRQARKCGVGNRIHFAGLQTDVRPYYAAADAFVLPTLYDAFANAVLEAMACGLPVVTGIKCGAVDIIENGKNGFICDPLDTAALAACLGALQSLELRKSMGDAGRHTVEAMSFSNMRQNLLDLYHRILEADV